MADILEEIKALNTHKHSHLISMFTQLLRIRRIEEAIAKRYAEQEMRCPTHFSIGQEAVAVGVCSALSLEDCVLSAHRAHAHYLAKGGNLDKFIAELYGKETGCAAGRGGSMHLIDLSVGFLGCVPIVGSTVPIATGAALYLKNQNKNNISVVFFGDGATEEGVFYESLNFAKLHDLPVLFVCENNFYSVKTNLNERRHISQDITKIVQSFGINAYKMEGQNTRDIFDLTTNVVQDIKKTPSPAFLEFTTYRSLEHCGPLEDDRPKNEVEFWLKKDPVAIFQKELMDEGILSIERIRSLTVEIDQEIERAFLFAKKSNYASQQSLMSHVFYE